MLEIPSCDTTAGLQKRSHISGAHKISKSARSWFVESMIIAFSFNLSSRYSSSTPHLQCSDGGPSKFGFVHDSDNTVASSRMYWYKVVYQRTYYWCKKSVVYASVRTYLRVQTSVKKVLYCVRCLTHGDAYVCRDEMFFSLFFSACSLQGM